MMNVLLNKRKKKYFYPGGVTDLIGNNPDGNILDNPTWQQPINQPKKSNVILNAENRWNFKYDPIQKPYNPIASNTTTQTPTTPNTDLGGVITGGLQLAEAAASGVENGSNNWDKGKVQTQEGQYNFAQNQANDVTQSYTAGQNRLNLLSRTGSSASAKDLKTHKGWTNVLSTAGKGAAAGSTIGSAIMPGIGTAIGAAAGTIIGSAAAGIGEWLGFRKRKKKAEELAERKKETDYAVAYHNSRQAEQLASANDNAAKAQANLNRRNVLALAAYGGKLKRKNYLI